MTSSAPPGSSFPLGATVCERGVNFSLYSRTATGVELLLFDREDAAPSGGIGEHAPAIRARICRLASWLGLELDSAANQRGGPRISSSTSGISVWVIPTNEELMIAEHTQRILKSR